MAEKSQKTSLLRCPTAYKIFIYRMLLETVSSNPSAKFMFLGSTLGKLGGKYVQKLSKTFAKNCPFGEMLQPEKFSIAFFLLDNSGT